MLFLASLLLPIAAASANPWMQAADSPVANLFKRDGTFPNPDAADFASHYPPAYATPNATTLPKAWTDKLKTVSFPPNNPVSTLTGCCNVKYNFANGTSTDGFGPEICSFTAGCHTDSDLFLAPDGVFVLTFDDGPDPQGARLYDFLGEKNSTTKASHFMIGGNILLNPKMMQDAFNGGGHIAVHTWSHKYTTSLSNEEVLGELGWTMQIIHDLTGGRLPAYWRPPYGDTDNRVRAIAEQVFGMKAVLWNRDTNDWAIGSKPDATVESVQGTLNGWLTGSKSPGILALEHEINGNTIDAFMGVFDNIAQNGWTLKSVPEAFNMHWYQNAHNNTGNVSKAMNVSEVYSDLNATAPLPEASSAAPSHNASAAATSTTSASPSASDSPVQANKQNGAAVLAVPGAAIFLSALTALVL